MNQPTHPVRFLKIPRLFSPKRWQILGLLSLALSLRVPLLAATIVLDPGHGGYDPGGIPRQRYSEKKVTLEIAKRVEARLKAAGHNVIMTRDSDEFVELADRVDTSNTTSSRAVFVSIHCNSAPNSSAHGIETYHYSARSSRLAQAIHTRLVAATGEEDRGVRRARFYVLRNNRRVAVLAELGFLTNAREGANLARNSQYQQRVADAVAAGIQNTVR
jgi:N-acetylmuramoyl-L-alanine amidase